MKRALLFPVVIALTACGATKVENPELACQRRLADAREAPAPSGNSFNHSAYAAVARTGCSPKQLAALDRILVLTRDLPGLLEANNRMAKSGNAKAQMDAFQTMNNAVIELDDLEQAIRADLVQMEQSQ